MTKNEFNRRWELDDNGGTITIDDIADCAKQWGLFSTPRTVQIDRVVYAVLKAAGVSDAENYNPANEGEK